MTSMIHMPARGLRATVSLAALACALGASPSVLAQETGQPTATATASTTKDTAKDKITAVPEVVVTGTNIKGIKPIAPVITITRQAIDESGYATIGDVVRSLPEDFAGGQNPGTFSASASGIANQNVSNGSTVNLFGLGSDATLTLVDGHRLPSDGFFDAGDISIIPLAAIQRVELVTDGSSAIYGSDAVAGVANFILRKDYDGLETSARVGGATEGGGDQQLYSVLGGIVRDHWHVLVSAEYQRQDPITASERNFTSHAWAENSLVEPDTSRSVLASGGIEFPDNISFSVNGIYSDRESGSLSSTSGTYIYRTEVRTPNYNVSETMHFSVNPEWEINLTGTEASSSNTLAEQLRFSTSSSIPIAADIYRNSVNEAEISANGTLLNLPSGKLRIALGGGYRDEGFDEITSSTASTIRASRDVTYAYGEAFIPLIPASSDRLGFQELELSASGRYEHYSDFGDTANPKVGLRYVPFGGMTLRGSWGTSFKAPSFLQQYQITAVYVEPASYWNYPGNALEVVDGNHNLKPETSKNWTIGVDYSPPTLQSLVIGLTYFNINYNNRIVNPLTGADLGTLVTDPEYAQFVMVHPSADTIQNTIADAGEFINGVGASYNPSSIDLIVNNQYQNAVAQVETGVNASYRQSFLLGIGTLRTFANATWNHLTGQLSAAAPIETLSGTIFNVPNFRARGGASWSNYGLTATAIVNYTSSERDTIAIPNEKVASFTTLDFNIEYKFPDNEGFRRGLKLNISATNLFDRPPPFAKGPSNTTPGIYYDSLNASAIGRFVAFQATKKW